MAKSKFKSHNPKGQIPPAQSPDKLPLPITTSTAFKTNGANCQNIGLIFERYLHFVENRDGDWDMGTYNTGTKKSDTAKSWNLNEIVEAQKRLNNRWNSSLLSQAIVRWQHTVESQHAIPFKMSPAWRYVVGLGDKTALEVGFTFHRIYGYPLIPGSALKGLARAAALWDIAEALGVPRLSLSQVKELDDKKKTPLQESDNWLLKSDEEMAEQKNFDLDAGKKDQVNRFRRIFGTQHAAGEAMFFEAVPAAEPALEVDVMTVHYPDYYGEQIEQAKTPPGDNQNPNPISFLTVGQTPFWFAVGWRGKAADEPLLNQAVAWLTTGLKDFGLGAKTAAGYGYFEEVR